MQSEGWRGKNHNGGQSRYRSCYAGQKGTPCGR